MREFELCVAAFLGARARMCEKGSSGVFYQLYTSNEVNFLRIQCARMTMISVTGRKESRARLPFLVSMTDDEIFMANFCLFFIYFCLLLTFECAL